MNAPLFAQLPHSISRWELAYVEASERKKLLHAIAQTACWLDPNLADTELPKGMDGRELALWFGKTIDHFRISLVALGGGDEYYIVLDLNITTGEFPMMGDMCYAVRLENKILADLLLQAIAILSFGGGEVHYRLEFLEEITAEAHAEYSEKCSASDANDNDRNMLEFYRMENEKNVPEIRTYLDRLNDIYGEAKSAGWNKRFTADIAAFNPADKMETLWKHWLFKVAAFNLFHVTNESNLFNLVDTYDEGLTWLQISGFLWMENDELVRIFDEGTNDSYGNYGIQNYVDLPLTQENCKKILKFKHTLETYLSLIREYIHITHLAEEHQR